MAGLSAPVQEPGGGAAESTPTARKPQTALWVFVGIVVLSVAGSLVTANALRSSVHRTQPVDVVRSFLEALAAGDATTALSYAVAAPADQTLLTDAVLAESMRVAPMRDIQVDADAGSPELVRASYTLGTKDHDDTYTAVKVGTSYKLDHVSASVYLHPIVDKFPVVVNGTPSTSDTVDVFPVTQVVTTGLPNVGWGDATFVRGVNGGGQLPTLEAQITAAGKRAFLTGAKKRLGDCLARHELAPKNCPFGFTQPSSGPKVKESSVRWTVKGNPWAKLDEPEIDAFLDQGTAKAGAEMTVTVTCRFTNGAACRPQDDSERVTFAGGLTTDPMRVVFTTF